MVQVALQVTDRLPRVGDSAAAERGLARWSRLPDAVACASKAVDLEPLLASIFGNSPYLSELLLGEPAVLGRMLEVGPDAALDLLLAERAAEPPGNRARLMGDLRRTKRRVALLTALADITGLWTLERTTEVLSRFADLAAQQAVDLVLREGAQRGELELTECGPAAGRIRAWSCSAWASSARSSSTTPATSI